MPREPGWWYRPVGAAARVLQPVASVYGAVAARRSAAAPTYTPDIPVICVGNFTAGGSGKTPFTAMLVARLIARGERPVILTRGYGGSTRGPHRVALGTDTAELVGDEPLLLARVATVVVARDRPAGAALIEAEGTATVIVMDDGLQNPTISKSLTFAVVDGTRMFGNGRVIPSGPLRMPLAIQSRLADALVINGALTGGGDAQLRMIDLPRLQATLRPSCARLDDVRVVAYAGIGNPERFFETVRGLGASVAETIAFADHAAFTDRDATRLLALADEARARLVTTEKDIVRLTGTPALQQLAARSTPIPVAMELDEASRLDAMLDAMFSRGANSPRSAQ